MSISRRGSTDAPESPLMTRQLFGTDGVRGVAGELLSADLALALGRAATARVHATHAVPAAAGNGHANGSGATSARPQVLIIRDTRESGEMLQAALAAGVSSAGGDALLGGVLPTPAAPLLIARYGFDLAAVISASGSPATRIISRSMLLRSCLILPGQSCD